LAERERRLQAPITLSSWMTGAKKDVRGLNPASQITLNPGTQYQIRDYTGKNEGQVIASGSTPEELLRLQDVARGLANQGRMADYRIEQVGGTPTGGLGQYRDPTTGEAVTLLGGDLYNSPGTKVVGDILKIAAPIALQFVPGFGTVLGTKLGLSGLAAKAAGVGLTSALGRTGAGLVTGENIGEALKAGAIGGLTSAATAGLLDKIGVDKALSGASGAKGAAVGTNFSPVPGAGGMTRIPVGALANLKSSVIPASAFSGLAPSATAPIVVTGVRNAVTPAFSQLVSGAAASGFDPFLSDNAGMVGDGTTAPEPAAAEEPGIVVTSRPYPNVDLTGGLASVPVSTLLNLGINTPTDVRLDDTEIDVEGRRIRPGRVSDVIPAATGALNLGTPPIDISLPGGDGELIDVAGNRIRPTRLPDEITTSLLSELPGTKPTVYDPNQIVVTGQREVPATKDPEDLLAPVASASAVSNILSQQGKSLEQEQAEKGDKKGMSTFGKITGGLAILDALGNLLGGGGGGGAGAGGATGLDALAPTFRAQLPTPRGQFTPQALGQRPPGEAGRPDIDYARYGYGPARSFFNYVPETQAERDAFAATAAAPAAPRVGVGTVMPQALPGAAAAPTGATDSVLRAGFEKLRAAVPGASDAELVAFLGTPEGQQELAMIFEGLGATRRAKGGSMGGKGRSRESFAVNGAGTGRSDEIPALLSDGEYVIDAETVALLGDGSGKAGAQRLDEFRAKIRKHKGRNLAKGKFSVNAKRPERYLSGGLV
jgi:hypothetical protein